MTLPRYHGRQEFMTPKQAKEYFGSNYDPYVHPHDHRAISSEDAGWSTCIDPFDDHPGGAHGNIVSTETCFCGASRLVEVNQSFSHATAWK